MANLKKVTKSNHLPSAPGDGRFVVYSKQFNELIDNLNAGTGDLTVNDATISGDLTVTGTTTLNGDLVLGDAAADSLTIGATTTYSEPINYDNATSITAFAGGGQASATALTAEINNVTTVATAGDSVKLKTAVAGAHQYIKNSGATALDIFPNTSDSIDALAVNLAIRIQPGSSIHFYAKDATVWESSIDNSITLNSPTTVTGQLEIKASASAGNTVTTVTNASQAAARTYTIPDAGANADFLMTQGAQAKTGQMTFVTGVTVDTISERTGAAGVTADGVLMKDSTVALGDGTVGDLSVKIGADLNNGLYGVSDTQMGIAVEGALVATADTSGLTADTLRHRVNLGTTPVGTVSIVEYGDGRDVTTQLTLTNFIVGALAGAGAALGLGNIVYTFPAGQHLELVSSFSSLTLACAGTTVSTDTGLGSVIASGAISVLSGTATFEDRLTGQTIGAGAAEPAVSALTAATAGIGTGISLNVAGSVKNVFLNSAGTWNVDNVGSLTASGTIVLKWTKM